MIPGLALFVLTSAPANFTSADLPQLFQSACLDREATLSPGTASAVGFDGLSEGLRRALGTPMSGNVWRLNTQGTAYLYILDYKPGPASSPRVCGVASDQMDPRAAHDTLELRVTGRVSGDYNPSMEWLSPQQGYRAVVMKNGKFRVVQVEMLSDAQRDQAMKAYQQLKQ